MFKIAICDDDKAERFSIVRLIDQYQESKNIKITYQVFENGLDLIEAVKREEYQLVFLDIIMPGITGIETAKEIREFNQTIKILFLTSSPEFAVDSYSVDAYFYLLKPICKERVFSLLDKALSELKEAEEDVILLKTKRQLISVAFSQIEFVEIMNKMVSFHIVDEQIIETSGTLCVYEEKLFEKPEFLKVHRSYIINMLYVKSIERKSILMQSNHEIPLSRSLYSEVKEAYINFLFHSKQSSKMEKASKEELENTTFGAYRILLIDDELKELEKWSTVLRRKGCVVDCANCIQKIEKLNIMQYDCIILEAMLGGESTFSFCKKMRKEIKVPIIFLTYIENTESQLKGFSSGVVDYITKNTSEELFWSKVKTWIRHFRKKRTQLCFDGLMIDFFTNRVLVENEDVYLTPKEFTLLWVLAENAGQIYSVEELYQEVWGGEPPDEGQGLQVHMSNIRRKINMANNEHIFIETIRGEGYRFCPR